MQHSQQCTSGQAHIAHQIQIQQRSTLTRGPKLHETSPLLTQRTKVYNTFPLGNFLAKIPRAKSQTGAWTLVDTVSLARALWSIYLGWLIPELPVTHS